MKILLTTTQVPFIFGGAEVHARELRDALCRAGHEAEIVAIPFRWYPPEKVLDHLLACRLLDLRSANGERIDRVIGLKFPAYHIPHERKVLWVLHQHRPVFDLWGTPDADPAFYPEGADLKHSVTHLEKQLLQEATALFANSGNVAARLEKFSAVDAAPLYHPPQQSEKFYTKDAEDFFFFPSRVCEIKRQWLVVEALAHCKEPVKVVFAGKPDNPGYLAKLEKRVKTARATGRVRFAGMVSEEEKRDLYARCRAVVFTPTDEDYGYITLEAMLAQKPVVTCTDSGGPLEFVVDGENGLIAESTPEKLAAALDRAWRETTWAREAGVAGRARYDAMNINWPHVVQTLLDAG